MSIFYVFQSVTYKYQRAGGYLWSPQKTVNGRDNPGYYTMKDVKPRDIILHGANQKTLALSIVTKGCYSAEQPDELKKAKKEYDWNDEGYRVDSKYYEFTTPVNMREMNEWLKAHYHPDSAFKRDGSGQERYLCNLQREHAVYILKQAYMLPQAPAVQSIIKAVIEDLLDDKDSEYGESEIFEIESLLDMADDRVKPIWNGRVDTQDFTINMGTGHSKPKRDPQRAANALEISDYYCEYDKMDRVFLRKNGKRYTEPHHLIPMSKYADFAPNRVDVEENITSLCSHCHNLLHYGNLNDKRPILQKLYNERRDALKMAGLEITFEKLLKYYE